jgi:uncharacterized protein YecE (DUF72 family)
MRLPYRLGLPAWAFPGWRGRYFDEAAPLASYARVFNAVEGNTTFYAVPEPATVAAWAEAVSGRDFEFCFKLPRSVTHGRRARFSDLQLLLSRVEVLGDHLGPFLVQLPQAFGPDDLPALDALLAQLPTDRRLVVEVRHPGFFENPQQLLPLLERHHAGRVCMDTRALYRGDRTHPEVAAALHEKPDLPVLDSVCGRLAFTRLVLHPDRISNRPWIDEWSGRLAAQLAAGHDVYMMVHCPNNLHCPELALALHESLTAIAAPGGIPPLPGWPIPQQGRLL